MGYFVEIVECNFVIPEREDVLQVLRDLNKRDDLKRGFEYIGGKVTDRYFSWMPSDYDETVSTVRGIFELLGFQTEQFDNDIHLLGYDDKTGQEALFLSAVAPFVSEGSFIVWRGEDNAMWIDEVSNGVLTQRWLSQHGIFLHN